MMRQEMIFSSSISVKPRIDPFDTFDCHVIRPFNWFVIIAP